MHLHSIPTLPHPHQPHSRHPDADESPIQPELDPPPPDPLAPEQDDSAVVHRTAFH